MANRPPRRLSLCFHRPLQPETIFYIRRSTPLPQEYRDSQDLDGYITQLSSTGPFLALTLYESECLSREDITKFQASASRRFVNTATLLTGPCWIPFYSRQHFTFAILLNGQLRSLDSLGRPPMHLFSGNTPRSSFNYTTSPHSIAPSLHTTAQPLALAKPRGGAADFVFWHISMRLSCYPTLLI